RIASHEAREPQLRVALERAKEGRGQLVAVVGEPGVGKSRLYWEVVRSHRTEGCLVLASRSVSYGQATSYLPVSDLLKAYFAIEARDDPRRLREKVTGRVLSLDEALRPTLPAFLALLDLAVVGKLSTKPSSTAWVGELIQWRSSKTRTTAWTQLWRSSLRWKASRVSRRRGTGRHHRHPT